MALNGNKISFVESGIKVFALFNLLTAALSSALSTGALVYWASSLTLKMIDIQTRSHATGYSVGRLFWHSMYFQELTVIVLLMMFSLISLMFAVFLINGVFKKKPEYLKVYFVYGVVVTFLSMTSSFAYNILSAGRDVVTAALTLLLCFVFSLVLYMIRETYKKYEIPEKIEDKLLYVNYQ